MRGNEIGDRDVIRLDPDKAFGYTNRGAILDLMGEHDRAIADFNTAIRMDPAYPLNYVNRAGALLAKGNRAAALTDTRKALTMAPNFPPALDMMKKIEAKK